jgi:hypothetical protein
MSVREPKRFLLHGAVAVALLLLARFAWEQDFFNPGPQCPYCEGKGLFRELRRLGNTPEVIVVETECRSCDGSGLKDPYGQRFRRVFPRIALGLWEGVCLAAIAGLVWGLRVVDCRLCLGAGNLSLEAFPPGEPSFAVMTDCVGCEGRGRLGVLDRWVLWNGWERRGGAR